MKRISKLWVLAVSSILSLSACGREIDCDIEEEHFHYYRTPSGIERLMDSEKEYNGSYERSDDYVQVNQEYQIIVDNHLCILSDNLDYVEKRFEDRTDSSRLELVYEYVPEHYGFMYIPGEDENIGSFEYGLVPERRNEYWKEIGIDEYTENPVKDIEYQLLLYRILPDGKLESKTFKDLDSIEEGFNYFKTGSIITKVISDEYYLNQKKKKVNVIN